jgi:hypothetical protein
MLSATGMTSLAWWADADTGVGAGVTAAISAGSLAAALGGSGAGCVWGIAGGGACGSAAATATEGAIVAGACGEKGASLAATSSCWSPLPFSMRTEGGCVRMSATEAALVVRKEKV